MREADLSVNNNNLHINMTDDRLLDHMQIFHLKMKKELKSFNYCIVFTPKVATKYRNVSFECHRAVVPIPLC